MKDLEKKLLEIEAEYIPELKAELLAKKAKWLFIKWSFYILLFMLLVILIAFYLINPIQRDCPVDEVCLLNDYY